MKWFSMNVKSHNYFILTDIPIILLRSMVYPENYHITLNHHRNTPFFDEGGKKTSKSYPEPGITQCVDLLTVYSL